MPMVFEESTAKGWGNISSALTIVPDENAAAESLADRQGVEVGGRDFIEE